MKRFWSLISALIAWAFISTACWAQGLKSSYSIGPEPSWISATARTENGSMPTNHPAGVLYLFLNRQVDVASESVFRHEVKRVTSENGVQNESELEFTYEPSHQTLQVHKIQVRRDGKTQDRLKPETFRVIQQERDSYRHIYNGEEAVVAILEDVRVGDQLEYSYTIRGFNPIFGNRYVDAMLVQWSVPVFESRVSVLWPKNRREPNLRMFGRSERPIIRDAGQAREYAWNFSGLDPILPEEQLPGWYTPYPWLQVSEFATWAEVRDWALELYEPPAALSEQVKELIERLKKEHPDPPGQALAALKFVQDEVRYLGIEIGPNSHQPHDPSTVLGRRFGDCKDKTMLLCALLRGFDLEAHAALVNTYLEDKISERLPSPLAFNHVIVRAQLDGKTYWLDPTLTHQKGGLKDVSIDNYAKALVVDQSEDDLVSIPPHFLNGPHKVIQENLVLHSYDGPADFEVVTTFEGSEADSMRRSAARYSLEELQKQYLNYYLRVYSGVSNTAPLRIVDDAEKNRIIIYEKYHVQEPWTTREEQASRHTVFTAFAVTATAPRPQTYERKMPLGLHFPAHVRHIISVDLPAHGEFPNESKTVRDDFQVFRYEAKHVGKNLLLTFDYRTLTDVVPVDKVADYLQNLEVIHETCSYSALFPKTSVPENFWKRVNWPILALGLMTVGILGFGAVKYYRYRPAPLALDPANSVEIDPKLQGLGGWLSLVAFGLLLSPFTIGFTFFDTLGAYSPQVWHTLASPSGESFHPLWGVILIGEFIGNLTLLALVLLLIVLFFQKRATFPRLYIVFLVFGACFQIVDLAGMYLVPALAKDLTARDSTDALRAVVSGFVWISYTLKSKRVKATFIR